MEALAHALAEQSPRKKLASTSHRKIALLVGLLFISQMIAAAVGNILITSYFSGESSAGVTLFMGVSLMVGAGLAVAAIGIAMFPVLRPHGLSLSMGYLVLRLLEFITVLALGAYFLASKAEWKDHLLLVYAFTAPGGLILSYLLLRSGLVSRWLAILGTIGYGALLLGTVLAALRIVDLDTPAGFVFFVPGGLFELVFLPLVLILKGFNHVKSDSHDTGYGPELVPIP